MHWQLNQQNLITFVMVDANGVEVPGLGSGFTLSISKNGSATFVAGAGVKAEMADGWYSYLSTAGEADTPGTVSIKVTGAGAAQQNLEYVVVERAINAVEFTYVVTNTITMLPEPGVLVWIKATSSESAPAGWSGLTDAFGVARDADGNLPRLDPGTWYFWRKKIGFIPDPPNPDSEVVP